jgi:hypothetical protein
MRMSTVFIGFCTFLFGMSVGVVIGTGMETWHARRGRHAADVSTFQPGVDVDELTSKRHRELLD